jgi:competence protein ComGC
LLHHKHLFGLGALLIALKVSVVFVPIFVPSASLEASAITPKNIVALTNVTRQTIQVSRLTENATLDKAAQQKADDMVANNYFSHESPVGKTAMDLILADGYPAHVAAENLAVRYTQAEDVQTGWLLSPTHRENIVNPAYADIGVGVAQGPYKGSPAIFVVQLFGRTLEENLTTSSPATSTSVPATANLTAPHESLRQQITSALQTVSGAADAIAILMIFCILLLTLSYKFHERHLATITEALAVIGLAIVLHMV